MRHLAAAAAVLALCGAARADTAPNLIYGHSYICRKDAPPDPEGQAVGRDGHVCNEDAVLDRMYPVMKAANAGARIYYRAPCQPEDAFQVPFPKVLVSQPLPGLRGIDALASAFRDDPQVRVTESNGVVRVFVGEVPRALLDTRILHLRIAREDRYDLRTMDGAVGGSKAVIDAMTRLGYETPLTFADFVFSLPDDRMPHFRAEIDDLSLDRALDEVAATFKGVLVHGVAECGAAHILRSEAFYPPAKSSK